MSIFDSIILNHSTTDIQKKLDIYPVQVEDADSDAKWLAVYNAYKNKELVEYKLKTMSQSELQQLKLELT